MRTTSSRAKHGFSIVELLVLLATAGILVAATVPTVARGRTSGRVLASLDNLVTLGAAHAIYAADWDGRQITVIVDDISSFGDSASQAFPGYAGSTGEDHPALYLGWGFDQSGQFFGEWRYSMSSTGNYALVQPITFDGGQSYYGFFRMHNTRPLHDYVNGRYYDPVFYPPGDVAPWEVVEPGFDDPNEWVHLPGIQSDLGDIPAWAGYCPSPAAMFDPEVMRAPPDGGWQDPWTLDDGFRTPGLFQALYPSLKTQLIEHHWIQNAPADPCNPAFAPGTFDGCEPYYFNMGFASEPATLFFDMSVRLLPNTEVLAADAQHMKDNGYGLWSRDTPFGKDGYLSDFAYDAIQVSHHVLTTDGILGRDTLADAGSVGAR